HPPFSGKVADGFVWGRGTLDDKVGVVGILEAVEALIASGFEPRRTLYLAFGHDEEVSGLNGALKIVQHFRQRNLTLEFVLDEGTTHRTRPTTRHDTTKDAMTPHTTRPMTRHARQLNSGASGGS